MKKYVKFSIAISLFLVLLGMISGGSVIAQDSEGAKEASDIFLKIEIKGLEKGDTATLLLAPEASTSSEKALLAKTIRGSDKEVALEVTTALKDGNYQLVLDTTEKYFREPKGYFFKVHDSQVVNPRGRPMAFDLIPPEGRDFEPYRGPATVSDPLPEVIPPTKPVPGEVVYRAEYMLSLSAVFRQDMLKDQQAPKSALYHYFMVATSDENKGNWGALGVVNTGVRHDISPYTEFALDHVYSKDSSGHWIEIGWVEHSDQLDYRYLFEFDSNQDPNDWRIYFQVSDNTTINVATMYYSDTTWVALYWNGSRWVQMAYEDIGFSTATNTFNGGEVYTYDGTHPSFPTSYTTTNELYVSGDWDTWDTDYSTWGVDLSPYDHEVINSYYYFYIYKE